MIEIEKSSRLARELSRAYRNHKYEVMPEGALMFHESGLYVGGVLKDSVNMKDERLWPNMVVREGRRALLVGGLTSGQQHAQFYIAPFTGNVAPQDTWTGANFKTNATEFVAYNETGRVLWNKTIHATNSSYNSDASPALFTLSAGQTNVTFRGYGILSVQTKDAITGILFSAVAANRPGLEAGDKVSVTYTLAATDAS